MQRVRRVVTVTSLALSIFLVCAAGDVSESAPAESAPSQIYLAVISQ